MSIFDKNDVELPNGLSEKTTIRLNKSEKEHLQRLRKKIKDKGIKYLIDDILLFKDRPQYVILKDMYPKYK